MQGNRTELSEARVDETVENDADGGEMSDDSDMDDGLPQ